VIAQVVFWSCVVLAVYAYAGYPAALAVISAVRRRPVRSAPIEPQVSLIITARNEEERLAQKIENSLAQDYPADRLEIIVASDCSTDRTDEIAREYPRVRLVRAAERRGKEAAQHLALQIASGEILVFSDVATALAPDGIRTIVMSFADPSVGCVSSVDRFVDADGRTSGEGAYVRYEMWLRTLETRVNSLVGLSGSFFAARRDVCRTWATDRQSDFSVLLSAVGLGLRGVLDPRSAGYYRNIADDRREFDRKTRTVVRGLAVLAANAMLLNPLRYGLFAWQLTSHKLCRWLVPFAMIGAAIANVSLLGAALYDATAVLQFTFYTAALAGLWTGAPVFRMPAFLVLANVGVLTAWMRFVRGERFAVWEPSKRVTSLPDARA